jgi:mannan endo-1,4-beta-mannosidase
MIRTCVATEGPDTEPFRIVPTIQPAMGQYDPAGVGGVMRFSEELQKRGLYAIYMLNNFWQWSGGFAQYLSWAGAGPIPYPPPAPNGNWDRFQHFSGSFYTNAKAVAAYNAFINFLVPKLARNPMIVWELANEPRGMKSVGAYRKWIDSTARLIKSLSPSQLVTTGSEGQTQTPTYAGVNVVDDHQSAAIDFICFHMWAANWDWVTRRTWRRVPEGARARQEVHQRARDAGGQGGKPILLEEFGFPRDGGSFDPASPVTLRDQYFHEVYGLVQSLLPATPMAGIMPWAWAGDSRPPRPVEFWKPGDPFIGDPPHEEQGWYSVFDTDSTLKLITGLVARASPAPVATS